MPPTVDILMYHAIADAPGPTSIAPAVFAAQMAALAASGLPVIRMDAVPGHLATGAGRAVAITFDDGFQDFADTAWPVLDRYGMGSMVYLPAGLMGGDEDWVFCHHPPRPLMGWDRIRALAAHGVDFGNHAFSHANLAALPPDAAAEELDRAAARLAQELGQAPRHCAPPYGATSPTLQRLMADRFDTAVGTRLAVAQPGDPIQDLPRLEMFYFTDPRRWQAQLDGRGGPYLAARRAARALRKLLRR